MPYQHQPTPSRGRAEVLDMADGDRPPSDDVVVSPDRGDAGKKIATCQRRPVRVGMYLGSMHRVLPYSTHDKIPPPLSLSVSLHPGPRYVPGQPGEIQKIKRWITTPTGRAQPELGVNDLHRV